MLNQFGLYILLDNIYGCIYKLCKKLNFITIYIAYILKRTVQMFLLCSLDNAMVHLLGLGDSVVQVLAGDNGEVYIHVAETLTPNTQWFIHARGLQMVVLSPQQYDHLMGNSPMNLCAAIQNGVIRRGDTPDNIWKMLCDKAGIVEGGWRTYAKRMAGGTLHIVCGTLNIAGSVLQIAGSAMCSASHFLDRTQ
jgi:hypothetical protein